MSTEKNAGVRDRRLFLRMVLLAVFSVLLSMSALYTFILAGRIGQVETLPVADSMEVEVVYPNGWSEKAKGNLFPSASVGYTVNIRIPLPKEEKIPGAALCFELYHNVTEVSWGGRLLAEDARDVAESGRQVGHRIIVAPIPDEAWGEELLVTLHPQERTATTSLGTPLILRATDARMYTLVRRQFDLFVFLPLLVFSIAGMVTFLLSFLMRFRRLTQGFFLSLFLLCVCMWYLCYQGMFHLISNNDILWAHLEDYALFMMPIPFLAYIRLENVSKTLKRVCAALEIFFGVLLVLVSVMFHVQLPVHVADLTAPMRVALLAASVAVITLLLSTPPEAAPTTSDKVLRVGLVVSLTLAALEMVRIILNNMPFLAEIPFVAVYTRLVFTRVMILAFLFTLLANFGLRLGHLFRQDLEHRQLETLAYTDLLTGIPNRQACERNAREIGEREKKGSAVLFFDSNDLKKANDGFSHDVGDELLRQVGGALQTAMEGRPGFYGRFGGDEFIACVYYNEEARDVRRAFYQELDRINREKRLPFTLTVACGGATYQELLEAEGGREPTMEEVIHLADSRMYENKIAMKKAMREMRFRQQEAGL